MDLGERLLQYAYLMRFHRPVGIFLLLWPTLWALWIAGQGRPDIQVVAVFVLGVIVMRAAGCVINDYADRNFDPYVARTRDRPLACNKVRPAEALGLFGVLGLVAFWLVLQLNLLTIVLAFVALFLAVSYPFMKRFIYLPQAYLGLAFGWAVPMAFAAQTGSIPVVAWWLLLATVLWALAYDTMYAMADLEDDVKIGVKSSAILFGRFCPQMIALIQLAHLAVLTWVGQLADLGGWYRLALVLAVGLSAYQQRLICSRDRQAYLRAFGNNSWLGAVIFLGIVLDYLLR